ncbi:MAG: hypothetical protein IKK92_06575 [Prevotella sp.]|nr:hypothetical protein [Prevotella sp.]
MKRNYIKPIICILDVELESQLMAASGNAYNIDGLEDISVTGEEWGGGDACARNSKSIWQSDEE